MINKKELVECRNVDISLVQNDILVDLNDIDIDNQEPIEIRFISFLEQIKNPYLFKVNDITVKMNFESNNNFSDCLANVMNAD